MAECKYCGFGAEVSVPNVPVPVKAGLTTFCILTEEQAEQIKVPVTKLCSACLRMKIEAAKFVRESGGTIYG